MSPHTNPPPPSETGVRGELGDDRFVGTTDLTRWDTRGGRGLARLAHRMSERLGQNGTLLVLLAVGLLVVVLLSVAVAAVYDSITDADGVAGLDQPLLEFAISLRSPVADAIVTGFTEIAGPIGMPVIAVTALLILSIHRRSWTPVILIVAAGGGSLLMTVAGKNLIDRVRPPLADAVPPYEFSASFPSGHTLNAVAVVGIIAYLLILRQKRQRTRVLTAVAAAVFALLVGLSRVFLGHHWFTDVLAGWLLGATWLLLVITAHRLYLTVHARRHPQPLPPPSAGP